VTAYLSAGLLLVVPTLFGIILINFALVQFAPGRPGGADAGRDPRPGRNHGPPHRRGRRRGAAPRAPPARAGGSQYRGARGIDPAVVAEIERAFGFDKPALQRFWEMLSAISASTSAAPCSATAGVGAGAREAARSPSRSGCGAR
jgi:microcin C transport system permease protein